MTDKRRWTTVEQRTFLDAYVKRYLEAQASRTYHKFWPPLFQDWFAKYPEAEPAEDDPTDSELEIDSEPDADSECESDAPGHAGSKRKRSGGKNVAKKLAQKVIN
jgi:hypothetical protein